MRPPRQLVFPAPSPARRGTRGPAAGTTRHLLFLAAAAGKWEAAEEFCLLRAGPGPDIWAAAERGAGPAPGTPGTAPAPPARPHARASKCLSRRELSPGTARGLSHACAELGTLSSAPGAAGVPVSVTPGHWGGCRCVCVGVCVRGCECSPLSVCVHV